MGYKNLIKARDWWQRWLERIESNNSPSIEDKIRSCRNIDNEWSLIWSGLDSADDHLFILYNNLKVCAISECPDCAELILEQNTNPDMIFEYTDCLEPLWEHLDHEHPETSVVGHFGYDIPTNHILDRNRLLNSHWIYDYNAGFQEPFEPQLCFHKTLKNAYNFYYEDCNYANTKLISPEKFRQLTGDDFYKSVEPVKQFIVKEREAHKYSSLQLLHK